MAKALKLLMKDVQANGEVEEEDLEDMVTPFMVSRR